MPLGGIYSILRPYWTHSLIISQQGRAGCGAGEPVARYFVQRGDTVTGIDMSERMLALAR